MMLDQYHGQLEAESVRSIAAAVTGTGTGTGQSRSQALKAGNTVAIDGVMDAKGTYGLIKVVHLWTPQGYSNTFLCTP